VVVESFHGPWQVKLVNAFPFPLMSFVVSGSNGSDGRYLVNAGAEERPAEDVAFAHSEPFELSVDGTRWTIQIDEDDRGTWVPGQAHPASPNGGALRRTSFDARDGLLVTLETGSQAWHADLGVPFGDILYPGVRLLCVSKDPATHPVPFAPHPDFSLPHGPAE
jgi:hypothetical protein